jgi:polyisoprenoid-binding protein YceI
MKLKTQIIVAVLCLGRAALGAPESFDFKDPKGINNAGFKLDAPLEAINGSASGISGTVTFDPADPGSTKGKILITSSSLQLPNPMQMQHMQGDKWLNVAKFPEISFESASLKNVHTEGNITSADVTGTFTLKGTSKEITAPVKFTYLKDKLGQRVQGKSGDLLVIRSNFSIKRSDFGINPGQFEDKVSETIEITLSIAGAAPK